MTSKGSLTQMPERREAFEKQNTRRGKEGWFCTTGTRTSFTKRVSPWDLERLIPVKSQVVIESCKGNIFTCDVVSLRWTREYVLAVHPWYRLYSPYLILHHLCWISLVFSLTFTNIFMTGFDLLVDKFVLTHQEGSSTGQLTGSLISVHSQLSGNCVRLVISEL